VSIQSRVTSHQNKRAGDWRLETEDFSAALAALGPFEPRPHLAVALSGGSDSMALALLADRWTRGHGGSVTALIVDHGLRAESAQEAAQVAGWMETRGIACAILTPEHRAAGNNLMQAARAWRYAALAGWCRAHDVLHCLLGHHAADQRETVALHVARGATEDGPSGMRRLRNYRGIRFLRPLLDFEKEHLRQWLREEGGNWVEDPTNRDLRFARAKLRRQDLPWGLPTDRTAREMAVARAAARLVAFLADGSASLDREGWRQLEDSIASQLLADLLRTVGGQTVRPRKYQTLRLADLLRGDEAQSHTLAHCLIKAAGNTVFIRNEHCDGRAGLSHGANRALTPPKPLAAGAFW
jgi:tRNA(Ile)-lysidine synthase